MRSPKLSVKELCLSKSNISLVFRSGKNFPIASRAWYLHAQLEDTLNIWFARLSTIRSAGLVSSLPEPSSCSWPSNISPQLLARLCRNTGNKADQG